MKLFCIFAVHIIFMFNWIFVLIVCSVKHFCMFSQFAIFLGIRMYENRLSLHTRSRAVQFEHTDNLLTSYRISDWIWYKVPAISLQILAKSKKQKLTLPTHDTYN